MARAIVIPLYDHTSDEEIREIMAELDRFQFALRPIVVSGYVVPDDDGEHSVRHDLRRDAACTCGGNGVCMACAIASIEGTR